MHAEPAQLDELLEAAYRQALARFDEEIAKGERDPVGELAQYRRRQRDYASLLRMGQVPQEASELAERLLATHKLAPSAKREFEVKTAELLVRLYAAFIERAERGRQDPPQGSR